MVLKIRPHEAPRAGVPIRAKQDNLRRNYCSDGWCGSRRHNGGKSIPSQERWVSILLPFPFGNFSGLTQPWNNSQFFLSPFNSLDSASSATSVHSQSRLMSALYWLCGMERRKKGDDPAHPPPPAPEQTLCSLEEKPCLRHIVNINLIICLCVTAFIVGYWAWQGTMCGLHERL